MHTTSQLIDAIKEKHDLRYDYQAANLLEVSKVAISKYRKNREFLTDTQQARVAELLGFDMAYIHTIVEAERTECTPLRESLLKLLSQMPHVAALLALVIIPFMLPVTPAYAEPSANLSQNNIYIMRTVPVDVFEDSLI